MKRLNLLEIKQLLNKCDDEVLSCMAIIPPFGQEDPEPEFGISWIVGDEEEADKSGLLDKIENFYESEEYNLLKEGFTVHLTEDAINITKAKLSDSDFEDVCIKYEEPDWM